jgi:hypothetical protein
VRLIGGLVRGETSEREPAEYDRSLVQRGDITLWISSEVIEAWKWWRFRKRCGQRKLSGLAIETALAIRHILHLPGPKLVGVRGLREGRDCGQDGAQGAERVALMGDNSRPSAVSTDESVYLRCNVDRQYAQAGMGT